MNFSFLNNHWIFKFLSPFCYIATAAKCETILDAVLFFINQLTHSMASLHHISCTYYIENVKVCKVIKTGLHIFYVYIYFWFPSLFASNNSNSNNHFMLTMKQTVAGDNFLLLFCFAGAMETRNKQLQCHCSLLAIIFCTPIQSIICINRQVYNEFDEQSFLHNFNHSSLYLFQFSCFNLTSK